jgi:hypothetical protein
LSRVVPIDKPVIIRVDVATVIENPLTYRVASVDAEKVIAVDGSGEIGVVPRRLLLHPLTVDGKSLHLLIQDGSKCFDRGVNNAQSTSAC